MGTNFRWSVTAVFNDANNVQAAFTKDGKFLCSDIFVETWVNLMAKNEELVPPLLLTPPVYSLKSSFSNPASIASAFLVALKEMHNALPDHLIFCGKNFLLPGVQLEGKSEDYTEGATDQYFSHDITISISDVDQFPTTMAG